MKQLILILTLLISSCTIAQVTKGYVTQKGTFDYKDSTYTFTNISGVMMTFDRMIGKDGEHEFIRLGVSKSYGITYHDFEIKRIADDEGYKLYFMVSPFDSKVAIKYGEEDFVIFYTYDEDYDVDGLWVNYYRGIILK